MGTEESVSVLRKGDICLDTRGCVLRVWGNEFPYEHEAWVAVGYLKDGNRFTTHVPANTLTRIDPVFYKLYGIEECDNESTIG